ncbi:hypothetical protein UT300003_32130 [Clostridium sardiniense]
MCKEKIENLEKVIAQNIIDDIDSYEGTYGCDLAYEMFNSDYYIIGTYQSKQFLKNYIDELFDALEEYNDEIGAQYPHITDAEKLATLVALHKAKELLYENEIIQEKWNEALWEDDIENIKEELKEKYNL